MSRFTGRLTGMAQPLTHPELAQLAKRIRARDAQQVADRARQRQLMRELVADGHTWDAVQQVAKVSRPTLRNALARDD